jgi:hypothetical protein
MGLSLTNMLGISSSVHFTHIACYWTFNLFYTTHKSSVSTGFTEQFMPILRILCYNGSLVTWTVVGLTTAKFKPLIFSTTLLILLWPFITPQHVPPENTVFTGPLPSSGYPSVIVCTCIAGKCLPTSCLAMVIHITVLYSFNFNCVILNVFLFYPQTIWSCFQSVFYESLFSLAELLIQNIMFTDVSRI